MGDSVSVIVPAYNEERYIRKTISETGDLLRKKFKSFEIIIVDDGSRDNTYNAASGLAGEIKNLKILRNTKNRGKGYSVRKGMLSAVSEWVAFMDADLSTPLSELDKFVACLKNGSDIAIGSRALRGSEILKKQGFLRRNMGKAFNLFVQGFLFTGIRDTQCGFKCFKREAALRLFGLQRLRGFCFDAEILYIAKKHGIRIKEIPVTWVNREDSRVSLIGSPLAMFLDIFRIRINDMRGCYEDK
jgi:dolichyl-phosphate beta-glucosyltransferase